MSGDYDVISPKSAPVAAQEPVQKDRFAGADQLAAIIKTTTESFKAEHASVLDNADARREAIAEIAALDEAEAA